MISPSGGISTVAGTGVAGYSGDNGVASAAQLVTPSGLAVDSSGALYIADTKNSRIRRISGGTITTVAGNGSAGYSGDGGQASSAQLKPGGVTVDYFGHLYIADTYNGRFRRVAAAGTIATIAGNGNGYAGDGGPGTSAQVYGPSGVAVDYSGNLYIADTVNNRIRKVSSNGTITTVAGTGEGGFAYDNGPATAAALSGPAGIAVDPTGDLFIADTYSGRIRMVTGDGIITTIAGHGNYPKYFQ